MSLSVRLMCASLLVFQMQQQELAQIRQREANLTALAAIGPRKKRKMDSPVRGASAEVRNVEPFCRNFELFRICKEKVNKRLNVFLAFAPFYTPGLGVRPLPAWRLQWSRLQTVYATAHHQSQPQGPALLPGKRKRDQSLTPAL